jgi:hypothetical protein
MRKLSTGEDTYIKAVIEAMISKEVEEMIVKRWDAKGWLQELSHDAKLAKARRYIKHVVMYEQFNISDLAA